MHVHRTPRRAQYTCMFQVVSLVFQACDGSKVRKQQAHGTCTHMQQHVCTVYIHVRTQMKLQMQKHVFENARINLYRYNGFIRHVHVQNIALQVDCLSQVFRVYRLADTWEPPCGPPFSVLAREVAVQVGVTNPFWQHLHACNMSKYLLPTCPNMLHQAIICWRTKWIAQGYNGNLQKDIAWTVIAAQTASPATQGIKRRGVKKWTNISIYIALWSQC